MNRKIVLIAAICLSAFFQMAVAAPVDVNTADAAAISAALLGVGPAKAKAIVDYRQANGPFKAVDDLLKVKGIGPAILKKNQADILLASEKAAPPKK